MFLGEEAVVKESGRGGSAGEEGWSKVGVMDGTGGGLGQSSRVDATATQVQNLPPESLSRYEGRHGDWDNGAFGL